MTPIQFISKIMDFRHSGKPASWIKKEFTDIEEVKFYWNELQKAKEGKQSIFKGRVILTDDYYSIIFDEYIKIFKIKHEFFEAITKELNSEKPNTSKINAPVIAQFCYLVNKAGIICKGDSSNEKFCREVCKRYDLPYTDRVRQKYFENTNRKNVEKVTTLILPDIDEKSRTIILDYLKAKQT